MPENNEREITFREILEVLWKGRNVVILSLIVCLICGMFYSFVVIGTVYESQSSVMVSLKSESSQKTIDLSPFAQQVKSLGVLKKIAHAAGLDTGKTYLRELSKSINIDSVRDSNLLTASIKSNDATQASKLANLVAYELALIVEISTKLEENIDYKLQLKNVQDQLKISQGELIETQKQLETIEQILITKKSFSDEMYLQMALNDKINVNNGEGSLYFKNEEINPVYLQLKSKSADASILNTKLETEQNLLEKRINTNNALIDELQKQNINLDMNSSSYYLQSNYFDSALITPAIDPESPGINERLTYILFAIISGLIISFIIIFFKEYWRRSSLQQ